ncbi:MAG: hypothetical protein AB1508_04105 [Pseudomonadota bacterium]
MRVRILLFSLAGFCLAGQASAGSRGVTFSAPHRFAVARMAHPGGFGHRGRFIGGAAALDTLQTGTFESGPDEAALPPELPPPYPPPYYYPAYYQPRPRCIRPLLIHVAAEKPAAHLPRVIYGTNPPDCPE